MTSKSMDFPSLTGAIVFGRSYSRQKANGDRESWHDVTQRTIAGLKKLGKLTDVEADLLYEMQIQFKSLSSGRWLWVGGTEWSDRPENYSGSYNCSSTNITDWDSFGLLMDLAMMGCGTGAVLLPKYLAYLPTIKNKLNVTVLPDLGVLPKSDRLERTKTRCHPDGTVDMWVGDSRQGWVESYQKLLELSSNETFAEGVIHVVIHLENVRPSGEKLEGFGGVANPVKLPQMYERIAAVLNKATGRQLTSLEACLLIDEAAVCIVAGSIRRSAGMRQFCQDDGLGAIAKDNLWQQAEDGSWRIDPERDALRMANHSRVFSRKPTEKEVVDSVRKQFYSGEGAIQWAGEALARANADLLNSDRYKQNFLAKYSGGGDNAAKGYLSLRYLEENGSEISNRELEHRMERVGLNPCGEIIGSDYHCNLSEVHLNQIDPFNFEEQEKAFTAAGLAVASLLQHKFAVPRYQESRELDPIVGVSFTGLFDFFVKAFGVDWLRWWQAGRPEEWEPVDNLELWAATNCFPEEPCGNVYKRIERFYLSRWRDIVRRAVWDYCDRHNLNRPNRYTCVQPAGTKSLLTGASPGWHPPFGKRYIRRITFAKKDPVALACLDAGYSIVPGQSDKDENGNLLKNPYDPRVTEWLVEVPVEMSWANMPGVEDINIEDFDALTTFDFYMQVQKYWTTHNTSATILFKEKEIEPLGKRIYEAIRDDEGYISIALLAKSNAPFPRLPFEAIDKPTYDKMVEEIKMRSRTDGNFEEWVSAYSQGRAIAPQDSACEGLKCEMPDTMSKHEYMPSSI